MLAINRRIVKVVTRSKVGSGPDWNNAQIALRPGRLVGGRRGVHGRITPPVITLTTIFSRWTSNLSSTCVESNSSLR